MALPRIKFGDPKKETCAIELSDDMVFVEKYKGHPAAVYMPKKHFEELRADLNYTSPLPNPTISQENHKHIDGIVSVKFQAMGKKVQNAFAVLDAFKAPKLSGLTLRKTMPITTEPGSSLSENIQTKEDEQTPLPDPSVDTAVQASGGEHGNSA